MNRLLSLSSMFVGALCALLVPGDSGSTSGAKSGGILRVTLQGPSLQSLDYVDPALSYTREGWTLLDTTCARLMAYPDKPAPAGYRFQPEVATGFPKVSPDGKTYTFKLRSDFRFSDGSPVRASAFARAINRTLAPNVTSPAALYTQAIVGAEDVRSGKTQAASGVVAQGNTLAVRFRREIRDFAAWTTMPFFCAVPPTLPSDPEGVGAIPAAGPYYIQEYRPGERVVIRRNRFYRGDRPRYVDGFDVDFEANSPQEVLDRIERGKADWGYTIAPQYFDPGRRLVAKYGINRSQFWITPGITLRAYVFNSSRPLFQNNPKLRRAVNFALDRWAFVPNPLTSVPTDQHLPAFVPGFRPVEIYPLQGDLDRARQLARGNLRGRKAVLYVSDFAQAVAGGQLVKQQLAEIGLEVELRTFPVHVTSSAYLGRLGDPREPWDIAQVLWTPDFIDPYGYINRFLDAQYIGGTNFARFDSPKYDAMMRRAARLQGAERERAYAALDVQLSRDAAPLAPIDILNEATLVSARVGCIVHRPAFDLTAACLKQ